MEEGPAIGTASIDYSPRRVWSGLTVPGKKMMVLLESRGGIKRGQALVDLYKAAPYMALLAAALALHVVPERGAQLGPAFRDLSKPPTPGMLHGAILTDIRDFLKLRFRAKGLAEPEVTGSLTIEDILATDSIRETIDRGEGRLVVSYIVNYVVTSLDVLSRDPTVSAGAKRGDFNKSLRRLRDMLRAMVEWALAGDEGHLREYVDSLFEEPLEANQDSPAV
jgi:hypothetical protein